MSKYFIRKVFLCGVHAMKYKEIDFSVVIFVTGFYC
jgi:hypothetical protein